MADSHPSVDQYLSDHMDAIHQSPKLIIEKSIIPSLTIWVSADGTKVMLQRWYDVTPDILNGIGVRSRDFVPDSDVRLVDKDGKEIHRIKAKLTDDFDGLPVLLARIEKTWSLARSASEFWTQVCDILIRSRVPSVEEVASDFYDVRRTGWLELSCFWVAFLARLRHEFDQPGWDGLLSGDQLIFRYIDFYNESPSRGPELREPSYQVDRVRLQSLLDAVREASTNQEKKKTLETLAEYLLKGVTGFEVLQSQISATGEIDLVVRNNTTHPVLARLSSHILVECKHWAKTIGTDTVGALIADLRDANLTSGFLICRKSISNAAKQRRNNFFQRDKGFIIVFTEADIQSVCDGVDLTHLLVERLEAIIFQR